MEWAIMALIILSIVGSMMWMMPSPRQRAQAIFRQQAMRAGIQVQMTKVLFPRAIGEHEPEELHCIAYRLGRTKSRSNKGLIPWHIFRLHGHAITGLPEGWCWGKGEGYLAQDDLSFLAEFIAEVPADIYSIESTPIAVSVYWNENGTPETVDNIVTLLKRLDSAEI